MKRILYAALMAVFLATPAFAAKLYLKEGGVIQAKRVWREGGKVYVLATRDTMTSFEPCEVDLKRTFVKKPRAAKTVAAVAPQAQAKAAAPIGAVEARKPADKKVGVTLPNLPKLPERTPESLVPSSGTGGTIKQQKKNMAEKLGE
jgi:hypothetical protein